MGVLSPRPLDEAETQETLAQVNAAIAKGCALKATDAARLAVWERGWAEIREALPHTGPTLHALRPQYFSHDQPIRLAGRYWTATEEYWLGVSIRRALMAGYLEGASRIVELGCGTGVNLLIARDLFPHARLIGADWAAPAREIVATIPGVEAAPCNLITGEGLSDLPMRGGDVLTVHALEQTGEHGPAIIDALVARRPRRVLHIEPVVEFYGDSAFDDAARRYHHMRGYVVGLPAALARHEQTGRIRIVGQGRSHLGNLYHEAYSYLAWESG